MNNLIISNAPHLRGGERVRLIMGDVCLALIPATIAAVVFFGYRALLLILLCVSSCVIFEAIWQRILKKPVTITDLSAVVTGYLLALTLPVTLPYHIAIIGCFFAVIIVKQMFGGLGCNIVNPALAARVFISSSWTEEMTKWFEPLNTKISFLGQADAISMATPLSFIRGNQMPGAKMPGYFDLFIGNIGGSIGETCAFALILGGIYLLIRQIISWRIPVVFIGTAALFAWIFGNTSLFSGDLLYHILTGGILLGAIFMATDYTTSPLKATGQIIYAVGCGIITIIIRIWGGYPEGVAYAILLMNITVPVIDSITTRRRG